MERRGYRGSIKTAVGFDIFNFGFKLGIEVFIKGKYYSNISQYAQT